MADRTHDGPPRRDHLRPVTNNDDDALGRTPPNDPDAEMSVLGAMLLSPQAITDVTDVIPHGRDFYLPAHELVYNAIVDLNILDHPADAVTTAHELTKRGELNRIGGPAYLHTLTSNVPTAANAGYYADIVAHLAVRRRLVEAGTKITQLGYTNTGDLDDHLATATQQLDTIRPPTTNTATSTWQPVDLDTILDGTHQDTPPTLLARSDGACLLYPSAVHSIAGEPESGKTWVAILAVTEQLTAGHHVTYIDFEDRPHRIVARLLAAGATPTTIRTHFHYIRPETALDPTTRTHLDTATNTSTLTIIDGITEAMTLHGLSLLDNEDVARWLALLPRHIADQGAAVLQIDHVVKNHETRGRYAIGGQHKLAGIDGAAYKIAVTEPFARGKRGHARITVDKDREGHVRAQALGHTVATLTLDSRADEHHTPDQLRIYLDAPNDDRGPDGTWRPTGYMRKISDHLALHPETNKNSILDTISGKAAHLRTALQALVNEGYVEVVEGPNRQQFHTLIRPFIEADE